ncbi:MAG: hypothetical protein AAGC60_14585 [Acidobacteriota bacterium]
MSLDRPWILAGALAYLGLVLLIGLWSLGRTRNARDFFIAGQGAGLAVTALGTMAAAFSGFLFIGGPGLTYRLGVGSFFIALPVSLTGGLLCWSVGRRLRRLAAVREVYTVPDVVLARWGSRRAAALAALAVLVGSVAYLGAQLLALAVLLDSIFGLSNLFGGAGLPLAMIVGVVVITLYSTAGGMVAGVYTDGFQGLLMLLAAGGVVHYALESGGGAASITRRIATSSAFDAGFLDPLGGPLGMLGAMGFFLVFSLGVLGQPQMLHKFFMLDDERKLRWMPLVLGGSQALVVLLWLAIGLAVPALVASGRLEPLAVADEAAPRFLLGFVPDALAGLVFAGVLAAIMSTADSFVNLAAAALVRDLPQAAGLRPRHQLAWGRLVSLLLPAAAGLAALASGELVALLGTFAFGIFGAALAPTLAIGLGWRRISARAARWSIGGGLALSLGLEASTRGLLPGVPAVSLPAAAPSLLALAGSFALLFWVASLDDPAADPDDHEPPPDIAAALEL